MGPAAICLPPSSIVLPLFLFRGQSSSPPWWGWGLVLILSLSPWTWWPSLASLLGPLLSVDSHWQLIPFRWLCTTILTSRTPPGFWPRIKAQVRGRTTPQREGIREREACATGKWGEWQKNLFIPQFQCLFIHEYCWVFLLNEERVQKSLKPP